MIFNRTQRRAVTVLLLCTLLPTGYGCSPGRLVSTLTSNDGTEFSGTFNYGSHLRQVLDVYRPVERRPEPAPVVVFFYGGRWQSGNRRDYAFIAHTLTEKGIVTVVPDYRVYPVYFVDGSEPPALLLHGDEDSTVWPRNTIRMAAAIDRKGGFVTTRIYSEIDHVGIIAALARPFSDWAPVQRDIFDFIAANSGDSDNH